MGRPLASTDWTARELGIALHAEGVRVHPFTDGNGRATRLHADLVFIAAQHPPKHQYDWDVDKGRYVELLRDFDRHPDVTALAAFIKIRALEDYLLGPLTSRIEPVVPSDLHRSRRDRSTPTRSASNGHSVDMNDDSAAQIGKNSL